MGVRETKESQLGPGKSRRQRKGENQGEAAYAKAGRPCHNQCGSQRGDGGNRGGLCKGGGSVRLGRQRRGRARY